MSAQTATSIHRLPVPLAPIGLGCAGSTILAVPIVATGRGVVARRFAVAGAV